MEQNPELKLAFSFLLKTSQNLFLTGKAGTGKTTFLHQLRKISPKRMIVLSPTGVAAINAGGVTIHSFFQMPFGPWIPQSQNRLQFGTRQQVKLYKFSREKRNIIKSLDLVVIDEISMVRADLLDGIDELLKKFRRNNLPFGGVQLLMIGDLQQLAPVVKNDEWEILKNYYETPFFFHSHALKQSDHITIELKKVYRQSDREFIDLLNRIRCGDKDCYALKRINERYQPGMQTDEEGSIILTTHNYQAKRINDEQLEKLKTSSRKFAAVIDGEFPEYAYPTDLELELKVGAQVMFVKNDSTGEKRFFNGKIGKIQDIRKDLIYVKCPDDQDVIPVKPECWQNVKYALNESGEIVETVNGTFTQYPLKPAWAITIHKSQGLTFDKVVIDAGAAFAHGQVYVALSRCRTFEGLVLKSLLSQKALINNTSVLEFTSNIEKNIPDEKQLEKAVIGYQYKLICELFDFISINIQIKYLLRLIYDNRKSISMVMINTIQKFVNDFMREVIDISRKFRLQIDHLCNSESGIEKNSLLQERIKKGAAYFLLKIRFYMENILKECRKIEFDNKLIRKSFGNCLKRLEEEMIVKEACLKASERGFFSETYLKARAKAVLEKPANNKKIQKQELTGSDSTLLGKLRLWRREKSSLLDLPEYMILTQKSLMAIAEQIPSTLSDLKNIHGIGKRKLAEFGEELLEITGEFCKDNGDTNVEKLCKKEQKAIKVNTRQISFDLFNSGSLLDEIALSRGLAISTIESHISYFIKTGQLNINKVMNPQKVSELTEFFIKEDNRELKPAKMYFGDNVSWGELRMAAAHLEYIEKNCESSKIDN